MAGLLDIFNSDEGMQAMGLLAAAAPSMAPQNFAGRLAQAGAAYRGMQDNQLKNEYTRSQIEENSSQAELRKASLEKQKMLLEMSRNFMGSGGSDAPQMSPGAFLPSAGYGPTMPMSMAGQAAPGSRLAGMSPDQIAGMQMMGTDLLPAWKIAKEGFEQKAGNYYVDATTGKKTYMGDPTKGLTLDGGGNIQQMQGSENIAKLAGQSALMTEIPKTMLGAAASLNLRENPDGTKSPVSALSENQTLQQMLQGLGFDMPNLKSAAPAPAPAPNAMPPRLPASGGRGNPPAGSGMVSAPNQTEAQALTQQIAVSQKILQEPNLNDSDRRRVEQDIQEMQQILGRASRTNGKPNALAYGMTNQQAAVAKGQESMATSLAGKSGEILQASSDGANSAVLSVQSAQRIQDAIASGKVMSGATASLRLGGAQLADTLGIGGKDNAEKIANTRQVIQDLAKLTLEGRRQMQGQGAISDREATIAAQATSGNVENLTGPEIAQLANAAERSARFKYAQHETKMTDMGKDASVGNLSLYKAAPMPGKAAQPLTPTRIKGSTDFDALPSGSVFIDPFGKTRRKP